MSYDTRPIFLLKEASMKIQEVIELILESAKTFKVTNDISATAAVKAEQLGWFAKKEFPAPYRDRAGRIDLFLSHEGVSVGIEVDRKTMKKKSIEKLRLLDIRYKILVVAYDDVCYLPDGIDAALSITTGRRLLRNDQDARKEKSIAV